MLFATRQNCRNIREFWALMQFLTEFLTEFTSPFHALNTGYTSHLDEITPINRISQFHFEDNAVATYHYYKHRRVRDKHRNVTHKAYFDLANALLGNPAIMHKSEDCRITQEGNFIKKTFIYKNTGHVGVLDKPYSEPITIVDRLLRVAEKEYYANQFQNFTANMRKTWRLLNSIINKTNVNDDIKSLSVNDTLITEKKIIVKSLNSYFANIGSQLSNKIPTVSANITDSLTHNFKNSFAMSETDSVEVTSIINNLKNKASSGYDEIPTDIIKITALNIATPLAALINISILTGKFPDCLKVAKVCPIYKSGTKIEMQIL